VGVVAHNEKVKQFFASSGIRGFSTAEVLQALEQIIERSINDKSTPAQIGLFDIDWEQWRKSNPTSMNYSCFQQVSHVIIKEKRQNKP
jgi:hypothetical protein